MFISPRNTPTESGAQRESCDPQRFCPAFGWENFRDSYTIGGVLMECYRHPESGLPCDCGSPMQEDNVQKPPKAGQAAPVSGL